MTLADIFPEFPLGRDHILLSLSYFFYGSWIDNKLHFSAYGRRKLIPTPFLFRACLSWRSWCVQSPPGPSTIIRSDYSAVRSLLPYRYDGFPLNLPAALRQNFSPAKRFLLGSRCYGSVPPSRCLQSQPSILGSTVFFLFLRLWTLV